MAMARKARRAEGKAVGLGGLINSAGARPQDMQNSPLRPRREPVFNLPPVILALLAGLLAMHAFRMLLSPGADFEMVLRWAVVPARWSVAYGGVEPAAMLAQAEPALRALAQYVMAEGGGGLWTGFSYALLHGSWAHVIVNSVWLAAFGTPVARRLGAARFLLLCAICAFCGAALYVWMNPLQVIPMIGASGAVSGLMASAAWFMFSPPVLTPEGRVAELHERPRESLPRVLRNRQVLIFLGVWFAINYIFALAPPFGGEDASIAWEAHLGGFLAGLAAFPLFERR